MYSPAQMIDQIADPTASGRPAKTVDGTAADSLPCCWAPPNPVLDPLKRYLAIATAALLVFPPVRVAIRVVIKLSHPGPILSASTLVGRGGKRFTWYKFKSMLDGDDSYHANWPIKFVQSRRLQMVTLTRSIWTLA